MPNWLKTTTIALAGAAWLAAAPAVHAQQVIKFAHNQQTNSPHHEALVHFKELVEQRAADAGYDVTVQIFPAMQVGDMTESTEQVQAGAIQMTQQPAVVLANWSGAFNLLGFPYLFPDGDTAFEVLNGPAGEKIMKTLEPEGFVGFSFWPLGAIYLTSNKETRTLADLRGQKVRVMPSPILIETFEAWGATPTPIGFGELYTALQQGVVDGQENPLQTSVMLNFWEVQKYFVNTRHRFFNYGVIANKRWWDGLPKELQQIIATAEDEAVRYHKGLLDAAEEKWYQTTADNGAIFIEPDAEALRAWKAASMPVHKEFVGAGTGKVPAEIYQAVLDAIQQAKQ